MTKVLLALVGFLGLVVAGMFILIAAGQMSVPVLLLDLAVTTFAFWILRATKTSHAPWRPVRLAAGVGMLLDLFFLLSLPWPPAAEQQTNWLILTGHFFCCLVVTVLTGRRAPAARVAAGVLAAYGFWGAAASAYGLMTGQGAMTNSPTVVLSITLVCILYCGSMAQLLLLLNSERGLASAPITTP